MATYAVGDIQGCYAELCELLDRVAFSRTDTLWCCGDLVNRGPASLETLRFIKALGNQAITVLGNHDLHLLAVFHHASRVKRADTLAPVLNAPDCEGLMHWLQQQPLLHTDPDLGFTIVHAGIPPQWSLQDAQRFAREVETTLQSKQAPAYFHAMYGNLPDQWDPALEGTTRLRVITNYLTRMRFCTPEGQLEFASKGGLDTQPKGFLPWYQHPHRVSAEHRILFGHWAALEGNITQQNVFALDTGCVWGGKLTALRLEDLQTFSVASQQPIAFE